MISGVVVRKSYFGGMPSESGISETWIGLLFFAAMLGMIALNPLLIR